MASAIRVLVASVVALPLLVGVAGTSGSEARFPRGCAPQEVVRLVVSFLDAYNGGEADRAVDFFAPATDEDLVTDSRDGELGFQWYSVSGPVGRRIGLESHDRSTLAAYFTARHERGEELHVVALALNYRTWLEHGVGIVFLLRRSASDLPAARPPKIGLTIGKAGLNCRGQTIYNWSAGPYFRSTLARLARRRLLPCKPARAWRPPAGPPLVCISR